MNRKKDIDSKNHSDAKTSIPSSTVPSDHELGKHDEDGNKIIGIERVDPLSTVSRARLFKRKKNSINPFSHKQHK